MNALEAVALPPFPGPRAPPPPLSRALREMGIGLSAATAADLPFLSGLYAQFRMPELLFLPWDGAQKQAFADDQFRLQHLHLMRHDAAAEFWVIGRAEPLPAIPRPIGRLYLDRSEKHWRLIDIILAAEARGRGLGGAVLAWVQEAAAEAGAGAEGVTLHVAANNPRARAFYLRLGFADVPGESVTHQRMLWEAPRG